VKTYYHAAALAVLGWFLMLPPTSPDYPRGNVDAPLSQWSKRPITYRDKDECEHVLDQQRRLQKQKNKQIITQYLGTAMCVSEDDPRLKK
jgi:hypothetical protein